jgi:hypothetical protein
MFVLEKLMISHEVMREALAKLLLANENDFHEAGMTYPSLETKYAMENARSALKIARATLKIANPKG